MKHIENWRDCNICILLIAVILLSACAGTGTIIDSPKVDLTRVELTKADFRRQTFLLSFDVSNPNAFPLPVKAVEYRVIFDDENFAGGKTEGSFTVPARGEDSFAISVELDLLSSASHLTSLLRPDFFGFDKDLGLQYRGRLDASRIEPVPDARRELFEAMVEIARSGQGPSEQIASMGCSVKWKAA